MINKKIEKNTHASILSMLFKKTGNVAYLNISENFSGFCSINNMTYITACHYFIDEFNDTK